MAKQKNDILVVGTVALDSVKTPFGEVDEALGGSATYFSMAASYFAGVKVVAVIGMDFPEEHIGFLKSRKIDVEGIQKLDGKTFRWKGQYGADMNAAETLDTQLNVLERFSPVLSASYKNTPYIFLANIDPDLQDNIVSQAISPKLIICDTMNFWITSKKKQLEKTLKKVNILIINETEAKMLAGHNNTIKAACEIREMGPSTVIVKRGEYGVICVSSLFRGVFTIPAFPLESPCDTTGAGDSFAGGFVGNLARRNKIDENTVKQSIVYGNIIGSFCVEDFSLNRYRKLKLSDIEKRYKEFKKLVAF